MALDVTVSETIVMGNKRVVLGYLAWDSSYAASGESLVAADMGLTYLDFILVQPDEGYTFQYDYTNATLWAYQTYATEASGSLSTLTNTRFFAIGA